MTTREDGLEQDILESEHDHHASLDRTLARRLAEDMAKGLKKKPKREFRDIRDQLLIDLLPLGTSYEQVQGYKRFLDRHMQRRAAVVRANLRSLLSTRRF